MRCYICVEEHDSTLEHVFPDAIGGMKTTDRVCKGCNNWLGAKVDVLLTDHLFLVEPRSRMGLAGKEGRVPSMAVDFLRGGTMADDPDQVVKFLRGKGNEAPILHSMHNRKPVSMPDGTEAVQVRFDASKGEAEVRKIIQRERKRHGVPPLTNDEMEQEVARVLRNIVAIDKPTVNVKLSIDVERYKLALLKIAYELACIWLGDAYLDDPTAAVIRDVLRGRLDLEDANLEHAMNLGAYHPSVHFWAKEADSLVAYSFAADGRIFIAIKVFTVMWAVIVATRNSVAFPAGEHQLPGTSGFLHIDARTRTMRETTLLAEFARISATGAG